MGTDDSQGQQSQRDVQVHRQNSPPQQNGQQLQQPPTQSDTMGGVAPCMPKKIKRVASTSSSSKRPKRNRLASSSNSPERKGSNRLASSSSSPERKGSNRLALLQNDQKATGRKTRKASTTRKEAMKDFWQKVEHAKRNCTCGAWSEGERTGCTFQNNFAMM